VLVNGKKFDFCAGAWGDGHHYWDLVDADTKKAGESENIIAPKSIMNFEKKYREYCLSMKEPTVCTYCPCRIPIRHFFS
jgi:hypothetical protein